MKTSEFTKGTLALDDYLYGWKKTEQPNDERGVTLQQIKETIGGLYPLSTTLANIAANTVAVTGPAIGETTDGKLVFLPRDLTAGTGDNAEWVEVGNAVDPATGLIDPALLPDLIIAGLRNGPKAELDAADPPLAFNEPAFETDTQVFRVGDIRVPPTPTATETVKGKVELATEAEVLGVSDVDAVVRAKYMRTKVEAGNGGAVSIGDLGGNARGSGSVTIQASRSVATQVASGVEAVAIGNGSTAAGNYQSSVAVGKSAFASGNDGGNTAVGNSASASAYSSATAVGNSATASGSNSTAVGNSATASGSNSTAVGNGATAVGNSATASGDSSTASGLRSTASGYYSTASGEYSTASGRSSTASGDRSTAVGFATNAFGSGSGAFGHFTKSATANAQELGTWSNYGTTREGAIRVHGTGYVAISAPQTDTAFIDGGATAGSEADGTIFRKGLAFRVSVAGNLIATYCKADGSIITKDLGAMT